MSPTTVHPVATFADLLRMELSGRGLNARKIAAHAGINDRTLRDHLRGTHPLPPASARALLAALAAHGPFLLPEAESELVIRADSYGSQGPSLGNETPLRRVRVDTVWIVIDARPEERTALKEAVKKLFTNQGVKVREGGIVLRHRCGKVLANPRSVAPPAGSPTVAWADREWSRVTFQLAPWRPEDRRTLHRVLRAVLVAQRAHGGRRHPDVTISRIDIASDYAVSPHWLLLNRPRARHCDKIVNGQGGVTWYFGKRARGVPLLRVYDGQARHGADADFPTGPWTRIEAEFRPPKAAPIGELAAMLHVMDPFPNFDVALRVTPGLSLVDSALVDVARRLGYPYVRGQLPRPDRERLRAAWNRLRASDARVATIGALDGVPHAPGAMSSVWPAPGRLSGRVVSAKATGLHPATTGWWDYVAELARFQLLYDPDAEEQGEAMRWDDPELVYPVGQ